MKDLKIHHKFRVFVFKGMVAMGGGNKDFLDTIINKVFDVFLGQALE
jgi:hypothetical protein